MLKTLTSDLIMHGKVETTLARAKEVKSIADSIIALAIKEKDNYEMVDVKVVKAKLDEKGNKVTELVKSKNGKEYLKVVKEETTEKRQKDMPSRLNARRKIMTKINKVDGVDVMAKLFNEIAPKYEGRVGGYTKIIKAGPRRGDSAEVAILQLIQKIKIYIVIKSGGENGSQKPQQPTLKQGAKTVKALALSDDKKNSQQVL